jgi:hypothetical protein
MAKNALPRHAGRMNGVIERHLSLQDGLISRRQALAAGLKDHDLRRLIRRREWAVVHAGVYVDHTGPLSWHQGAWAAVLGAWPAALGAESALRAADGPGLKDDSVERTLHVAVDQHRSGLVRPADVRIQRLVGFDDKVLWNMTPPRLRYEEAALDVAIRAGSELDAVATLAKACQTRRTTARRLVTTLAGRSRVARRDWLDAVLRDISDGTCSVLEHGFLVRVERAHGLPSARRQVRATASMGVVYRDAEFGEECIVELDGRLVHDAVPQRDADFERDLDAAVSGRSTVRLFWGQVFDRPCTTSAKLVMFLRACGIPVSPRACAPGYPVGALEQAA